MTSNGEVRRATAIETNWQQLRELIDSVWNAATDSEEVPHHEWADRLINDWMPVQPDETPPRIGPVEPNNDMVICPHCTSQFEAIPVNTQKLIGAYQELLGEGDPPQYEI